MKFQFIKMPRSLWTLEAVIKSLPSVLSMIPIKVNVQQLALSNIKTKLPVTLVYIIIIIKGFTETSYNYTDWVSVLQEIKLVMCLLCVVLCITVCCVN